MADKASLAVFASDAAGVRAGSFASASAFGSMASFGVVGLFIPSADDYGVPCGQGVFASRVEQWQRNLGLLFDASAYAFPGVDPSGRRCWFVFVMVAEPAPDSLASFLQSVRQCRVLWSVSLIGVVGPSGYSEV